MKTKIIMFFALLSSFCYEASARPTVIMQGGGRNSRFDYIHASDNRLICRGCGSLVCPVQWFTANEKGVSYSVTEIVDFVTKQIRSGQRTGDVMYADAFKLNWESLEEGFKIEMDVESLVETDHEKVVD